MKQLIPIVLLLFCTSLWADSELDQATTAAQAGYKKFISECLTPKGMAIYQLTPFENAANATIGDAIEIMKLTPEAILNYKQGQGVSKLLVANHSYYFPVIFNGKTKLLLGVFKWQGSDQYEIGSFGSTGLAAEFELIKEHNPEYRNKYRMIYAECYEANSCVFAFPELDDKNLSFVNITPGQRSDYTHVSTVDAVVKIMEGNISEQCKQEITKGGDRK